MKGFIVLPVLTCISLFLSPHFLKLAVSAVQVNYFSQICGTTYGNYSENSVYKTNLNQALTILSSQASNRSFYNYTAGIIGSDQVYALYLCRGDVNPDVCQSCVDKASNILTKVCTNNKVAVIWYDECMLRYSNLTIISIATDQGDNWMFQYGAYNMSNPSQSSQVLSDTMNGLIKKAVSMATSPPYFQTGEVKLTEIETLYCLVQCTPDITQFECNRCLQKALTYYPKWGQEGRAWAKLYGESCQFRYDITPFYTFTLASSPPLAPSPPPATNTSHSGGQWKRRRTIIIVSIVLSAVLVMMASICFLYTLKSRRIEQEKRKFENGEDQQYVGSQEFPTISLDIIIIATQDFLEVNKLGEGGFGPVYKGTLADGKEIAVKRLSRSSYQGLQELKNEVSLIARLQHRNLVRPVGLLLGRK